MRKKQNRYIRNQTIRSSISWRDVLELIMVVVFLAILVSSIHYIRRHVIFPVEQVQVIGDVRRVDTDALKDTIAHHSRLGLVHIHLTQLERELKTLHWIFAASARRQWANGLTVHIVEQKPIARWGKEGLMNEYGEVFELKDVSEFERLPMLYSMVSPSHKLAREFEEVVSILSASNLKVVSFVEDARQGKFLKLENGVTIALGNSDLRTKLNRFLPVYRDRLATNFHAVKKIDLRYTNGLAIEWKSNYLANFDST